MYGLDWAWVFLFAAVGGYDMVTNYCPTGCLQEGSPQPYLSVSAGKTYFQDEEFGEEIYVRYETAHSLGPFQTSFGASVDTNGAVWIGAGPVYSKTFADDRMYYRLSAITGLYRQGDGPDLGSFIEFRSSAEIGYQFDGGARLGLSFDHRSNAEISTVNPGYETIQLRFSLPL